MTKKLDDKKPDEKKPKKPSIWARIANSAAVKSIGTALGEAAENRSQD